HGRGRRRRLLRSGADPDGHRRGAGPRAPPPDPPRLRRELDLRSGRAAGSAACGGPTRRGGGPRAEDRRDLRRGARAERRGRGARPRREDRGGILEVPLLRLLPEGALHDLDPRRRAAGVRPLVPWGARDTRFVLVCVAVLAVGLGIGVPLFPRAFPEAGLDLATTREESRSDAAEQLAPLGLHAREPGGKSTSRFTE